MRSHFFKSFFSFFWWWKARLQNTCSLKSNHVCACTGFISETCGIMLGFRLNACSYSIIHNFRSETCYFDSAHLFLLYKKSQNCKIHLIITLQPAHLIQWKGTIKWISSNVENCYTNGYAKMFSKYEYIQINWLCNPTLIILKHFGHIDL